MFRRCGIVIGAVCVGFVHHCFYEMFDQLGPQLRWWAWNTDNPINHPMLASVPMTSVFIFATLGPSGAHVVGDAVLVGRQRRGRRNFSGLSLAWRTLAAGAFVAVGVAILSITSSLFGGAEPNVAAQAIVFCLELIVVGVIAVPVLIQQWSRRRRWPLAIATPPNEFVRVFGPVYLGILAVLWGSAIPEYFGASDSITTDGTPIGNLAYATTCVVVAAVAVYSVSTTARTKQAAPADDHALR